jgi:hypothetical protein
VWFFFLDEKEKVLHRLPAYFYLKLNWIVINVLKEFFG